MTKDKIYNWLFNIGYKNGLNKKHAQAFARNYTEDKTALKDMKRRFKINVLKEDFERTTYISKIGIYDKNDNLIMIAAPSKPIRKKENDEYTFKLTYDI